VLQKKRKTMLKNFFIVFFRNFSKNPFFSFLNTFGLAVGYAVSIMAILYIVFHLNINKCHKDYDKIYRIHNGYVMNGKESFFANSLLSTGEQVFHEVPGVENFTRVTAWFRGNSLIKVNDQFYNRTDILLADSNFIDIFSFDLVLGNKNNFLKDPKQIAITQKLSRKVFGNENPIGEKIIFQDSTYTVNWLIQDPSINSHIKFDMLIPFDAMPSYYFSFDAFTYIKFKEKPDEAIKNKVIAVTNRFNEEQVGEYATDFKADIMSLRDIYLKSNFEWEAVKTENIKNLYIFGFLGFLILFIALINFINLLTAKSEERSKEVGLKKVVGASKSQLKNQFIGETLLISFLSFLLSFVLVELLQNPINSLLNVELSLLNQGSLLLYAGLLIIPIFTGILAGFYPAIVLAKFQPVNIIKGIFNTSGKPNLLKVILVIIQFTISTLLISIILVIIFQVKYMKEKDLGFEVENLVVFSRLTTPIQQKYISLKNELLKNPNISYVTASHSIPGWGGSGQFIHFKGANPKTDAFPLSEYKVQDDFVETYGLELIAGRSFSFPEYRDSNVFIINETAAKKLGEENPIGKKVVVAMWEGEIVGIVKDFHFASMKYNIEPLVLSRYSDRLYNLTAKIHPENSQETIDFIIDKLKEYDPNYYSSYRFVEDEFQKKYANEEKMLRIIIWGSIIAIILSILGLFALTSYTIHKKYKEIGLRKVQGASVTNIVFILNKNILRWVLLTNIIAWPLGYYLMDNWLQNFAFSIPLHIWYFIIAGAISFSIALATITFQARRAALLNPVDIIKYE